MAYLMLRSLKQARYAAEPLGHFALAFERVHAFHFADPALSRLDRAPHPEMGAGERSRCVRGASDTAVSGPYASEAARSDRRRDFGSGTRARSRPSAS